MTLAEMATYVCTKVRETDTAAIAACKLFLKQRLEVIYNAQLWRESVGMVEVDVDPTATDNAGLNAAIGFVTMPSVVGTILAVRSSANEISPESPETFFRMDYDVFDQTGGTP